MTEHIPLFIARASNENDPQQNEACQLLIEIGPVVIPSLLKLAQESDMVWDRIDEIGCTMDKELAHRIIAELSRYPDEVLDAMGYLLQQPMKPWWDVAMQIIRAIGYPRNKPAIPIVILHASDWNSVAQQTAFHVLQDMGPVVVAQYLIPILSGKQLGVGQWLYSVYALCLLLNDLGPSYSTLCAPTIIYMMRQNEFAQKVEIATGLTVLEKIGPDSVTYTLPTLIDLASREGTSEVGKQVWRLIQSFGKEALEPYKFLLETIAEKPEQ
ncbi:MAG TPA: hypothetical protein VNG51_05800 [Ktedonobacteraceae bacterium]|nr:hypothetical protein [Ktedonobacteraceae bacterium]